MATTNSRNSREHITLSTVRHAPSVAWQRLGDEVVVLDMAGRTLVGLERAGAALWEAIGHSNNLAVGLDAVAGQLEQPAEAITDDLLRFTEQLVQRGLLVADGNDSAVEPSGGDTASSASADPSDTSPIGYDGPFIKWEEHLEEAGVFAGCAKDPFGELGAQCITNPFDGGS